MSYNLIRRFLRLPVIIAPMPYLLSNGALINADELMANFNFIRTSVNLNAAPSGATIEWALLSSISTFVGGTTFTVAGDVTATLPLGQAFRGLLGSGYTYGYVFASAYSASTNLTTITVTDLTTTLDSSLTEVFYGAISAATPSLPIQTFITATLSTAPQVIAAPSFDTVIFNGTQVDTLNEFNGSTGIYTALRSGYYRFDAQLYVQASPTGVLFTHFSYNGSAVTQSLSEQTIDGTYEATVTASLLYYITAGDTMKVVVSSTSLITVGINGSRFLISRVF